MYCISVSSGLMMIHRHRLKNKLFLDLWRQLISCRILYRLVSSCLVLSYFIANFPILSSCLITFMFCPVSCRNTVILYISAPSSVLPTHTHLALLTLPQPHPIHLYTPPPPPCKSSSVISHQSSVISSHKQS